MSRELRCSRRAFFRESGLAGGVAWLALREPQAASGKQPASAAARSEPAVRPSAPPAAGGPVAVSSANGLRAVEKAISLMQQSADPLDAAIAGVNLVEEDPNDTSVGYGGLPNEEGVVELDAAVMHGPTHRCGAVASLRGIKYPSRVAKLVMDRTDHILLVGEGALRFARAHGFTEENLLTEKARKIWLRWKETLSDRDDWLPADDEIAQALREHLNKRETGTIHLSALDAAGNLGSVTTTSGLAFKIPGRVGDSPIIGAGLYTDNDVGSCGSTGRGEANLANLCCYQVVESMRQGMSPQEACLDVCRRIAEHTREKRLLKDGKPDFNVNFYAINKAGQYGGAALHKGAKFAVHDGREAHHEECAFLFD
jgi:N4-(beta-N-acetylglucosaminyl)-L-asparaginase